MVRARSVAAIIAMMGVLAACGAPPMEARPLPPVEATAPTDAALARFLLQEITWEPCPSTGGAMRECATVTVPVDYSTPDEATATLALMRARARHPDQRLGVLIVNPGGPGLSAIAALEPMLSALGARVSGAYDVIAVDPRGVGGSAPLDCIDAASFDTWRATSAPDASHAAARQALAHDLVDACAARPGPWRAHVDTLSAARDLEIVRASLGEPRLSFAGQSYGTVLGATYALLYPARTGRMVLDAGVDPSLDVETRRLAMARALESTAEEFITGCDARATCRAGLTMAALRDLLDRLDEDPAPTDSDRPLTRALGAEGLAVALANQRTWSELDSALEALTTDGDGTALLAFADAGAGRDAAGDYPGRNPAASIAIECADSPTGPESRAAAERWTEFEHASPTFGRHLLDRLLLCDAWPASAAGATALAAGTARTTEPVLILSTRHDALAPHDWSVALARRFAAAALVDTPGIGHTSLGHDTCASAVAADYLLTGEVPADTASCRDEGGA